MTRERRILQRAIFETTGLVPLGQAHAHAVTLISRRNGQLQPRAFLMSNFIHMNYREPPAMIRKVLGMG